MTTPTPVSADELLRLFDGELSDADARALQARLSAQDRATLAAWQAQKDQLRNLGQAVAADSLPPELLRIVARTQQAHAHAQRWWRWGGMAASVALAFGLGWLTRGAAPSATLATAPRMAAPFLAQAVLAHVTYAPEVKHPVEVSVEQQAHLVQWLSKRLGRPLQVPQLTAQGYELMGGRLLPGDAGARAQFMFQRPDGLRLTLYVGAMAPTGESAPTSANAASAGAASAQDIAFAFSQQGGVSSFYWVAQGFGYALSAPLPRAELQTLAEAVYHQL